jgi:lysozyme
MTVHSAQGLDVSNYQGKFNWTAAVTAAKAAGAPLSFGITRVTQGLGGGGTNSPDPDASWDWPQILDHGLYRGGYHFLDPRLDGARQARYFVNRLEQLGLGTSAMLWLDNEASNGQPAAHVAACAQAFMRELVTLRPHNPRGVYTFINFARAGNCAGLGGYPLWLAYPASAAPPAPLPWMSWKFWQFGIRNGVDADAFNGTHDDLTAWIASYSKPIAAPPPPRPAPAPAPAPAPKPLTEGTGMIIIDVAQTGLPAGVRWPGIFLLMPGNPAPVWYHIPDLAKVHAYAAAGIPRRPLTYAEYKTLGGP